MKPGKHQRSKQRFQDLCWNVHDCAQSFVLLSYTMPELRNQHFFIGSSSVRSKQLLCFVHGQGQNREQKHTTKNFHKFDNHSPLLTMPKPRRKVILHGPSTSSEETPPTFSSATSSPTESDESERDGTQQQVQRLREELQNVLCLKESLEHDLSIFKFGLRQFKDSDKDMSYYAGLTYGQFVALFKFLNAHDICHRLNYWGSDYAKMQLPESEERGQKCSLEPEDELFLTLHVD